MRIHEHRCMAGLSSGLAIAALALLLATATGCGGSTTTATTEGSTPHATPSAAATPERLVGSDSVAVTQKAVDLARAALHAPTAAKLAHPYADDVAVDDFTFDGHSTGKAAVVGAFRNMLREYSDARWVAGYAGSGWAVIEERWDFTKTHQGKIELLAVQETRGGKVVYEGDYYQWGNLPLEPKPLKSAPGPADTPAAAAGVALQYAAALQAKDAAALAAPSAADIAFMDTASSTVGSSPGAVRTHYAEIFNKGVSGLAFTHLRYAFGRGWAAVIWTASSGGVGGDGVTVLEIRDGAIARETLYYNSSKMPF
jgi:hypothetical protein